MHMCALTPGKSGKSMMDAPETASIMASLRDMRLIGPAETPAFEALPGGVSADIVLVQTQAGPICVKRALPTLKVASAWQAPPSRGNAEKDWIRLVADILPGAVPDIIGEDPARFTFAMRYLAPAQFKNWKILLRDGETDASTAIRVAQLLGDIHDHTAHRPELARRFANDENFEALRLDPYLRTAARANPDVGDIMLGLAARTSACKEALVHGDFSPKNILIGANGPVILDAECAWYGDPAFDPAFCLNHLFLKAAWMPQHAAGYRRCAEAFWQAYAAALHRLDKAALEARVATLLPGLMLARIDGKSPVEYLTDPGVIARVRQFAKCRLIAPDYRVADLIKAWSQEFMQ